MGGKTVPQRVRREWLRDAGTFRRLLARRPRHTGGERYVRTPVLHCAGKQICLRLHPAPIDAECLKERRTQRYVAIMAAFPVSDMHDHPLAVDITHVQSAQFGATDPR